MEHFRKRNFLYLALFLFVLAAVISYQPGDAAILSGGSEDPVLNWIGPVGAFTAKTLFILFGLAVYPMLVMMSLGVIRNFLPYPLERKWYAGLLALFTLSCAVLFGLYPEFEPWLQKVTELGMGRYGLSSASSALTGGVLGQLLAAPPVPEYGISAGLIRSCIGEIGTLILVVFTLFPVFIFLLYQDYKSVYLAFFGKEQQNTQKLAGSVNAPASTDDEDKPPFPLAEDEEDKTPVQEKTPGILSRFFGGKKKDSPAKEPEYEVLPPAVTVLESKRQSPPPAVYAEPESAALYENTTPDPTVPPPPPSLRIQRREAADTPAGFQPAITQYADKAGQDRSSSVPSSQKYSDYELPSVKMLDQHNDAVSVDEELLDRGRNLLQQTLDSFGVEGHVSNIVVGPRVTQYQISLDDGVEINKVSRIGGNIAMKMQVPSLRLLTPIPGLDAVGVEVPNSKPSTVYIREVMESKAWTENKGAIPIVLGRDVAGNAIVTNLAKAPHMLIAGSTGSGKSVCMNTLIMSLLFKFSPDDLRLILVDPKVVEMAAYQTIPHLITPVVNDPKKAPLALRWGVNEMERRYRQMAKVMTKDLKTFNDRPKSAEPVYDDEGKLIPDHLPFLIIIIDELADIMMTEARKDVETNINRIAAKGRAAGVHLVIATQSPRKDVVTGLIKANLPVKIAFKVGTNMDSRVILDQGGAEKLLGMGDLLFLPPGSATLERIQMTLVTDSEIERIVKFCSQQVEQHFNAEVLAEDVEIQDGTGSNEPTAAAARDDEWEDDDPASAEFVDAAVEKYLQTGDSPLLKKALELIINERQASTSFFQRRLGIGYNKSAELVDQLERRNIISKPLGGGQKRDILILDGLEVAE